MRSHSAHRDFSTWEWPELWLDQSSHRFSLPAQLPLTLRHSLHYILRVPQTAPLGQGRGSVWVISDDPGRGVFLSALDGPPSPGTPLLHLFSLQGILKHLCSCPSLNWLSPLFLITWNSERIGSKSHLHLGFHEGPLSSFLSWNRECLTLHHIFLCTFWESVHNSVPNFSF